MNNVKIAVILLTTTVLSYAVSHAEPSAKPTSMITFLATEGQSRRVLAPRTERKKVAAVAHGRTYHVTATAYQAVPGQTDDEPFVTADNSFIKPTYGSKTRWLAISQDLLARWGGHFQYGDKVQVRGVSEQLDGLYTVHDTMNKRHRHCIDILTHPSEKFDIFTKDVKLQFVSAAPPTAAALAQQKAGSQPKVNFRLRSTARQASRRPRKGWDAPARPVDYFASAIL